MSRRGLHSLWLALVCLAAPALAQFSPSLWPSYEHPRGTFEPQLWQVYSGLVERSDVAGIGRPTPPRIVQTNQVVMTNTVPWTTNNVVGTNLYDGLREILIDYKAHTSALIPYFMDMTGSDTNGYLATNAVFSNWTTNRFIAALCLPSNYFEVTHFRFLSGLGALTNDQTVGRSHGYTNAWTAAGGTNFPPGRTNWYSTDYGVDGLRVSLKHMRYALATAGLKANASINGVGEDFSSGSRRGWSSNVTDAVRDYTNTYANITNWATFSTATTVGRWSEGWVSKTITDSRPDWHIVSLDSYDAAYCTATNIPTNYSASVDFYVRATNVLAELDVGYATWYVRSEFDSGGTDMQFMQWKKLSSSTTTGKTLTAISPLLFDYDNTTPTMCSEPQPTNRWATSGAYSNEYWGGEARGFNLRSNTNHLRAIVVWDFLFR